MNCNKNPEPPKRGMLVEDETVSAGTDEKGATVIKPKTSQGTADESVDPTDPREKKSI